MQKITLLGLVALCLYANIACAEFLTNQSSDFTLLSEKRIKTGKNVQILGSVGSGSQIKLGKRSFVQNDVFTNGSFKSASNSSISGRVVANDSIKVGSNSQIGRLDGGQDAKIGNNSLIFGPIGVAGNLNIHPGAFALGGISATHDSWNATGVPDPPATSFDNPNLLVDINVSKNQTGSVAPGNYADLNLKNNATIILSAGTYFFDRINMKSRSMIIADTTNGAVNVNVATILKSSNRASVRNTGENDSKFTVFGDTKIGPNNNILADIISLDNLKVGKKTLLSGSFFSEGDIRLGSNVIVNSSGSDGSIPQIPEPASALLLTTGIAALLKRRKTKTLS